MKRLTTIVALMLATRTGALAQTNDVARVLERQTQELLNAVTAGDARVWDRYLDEKVLYLAEDGTRKTKADLLTGERSRRPAQTLSIEAADVMFVAGQPRSRKIFVRGRDDRITGFVDRREGRDIPWTRIQ